MPAGLENCEVRLLGEESGQWKHVTTRTRYRKRMASEGELEFRNRFAELENEGWVQQTATKGGMGEQGRREEQLVLLKEGKNQWRYPEFTAPGRLADKEQEEGQRIKPPPGRGRST